MFEKLLPPAPPITMPIPAEEDALIPEYVPGLLAIHIVAPWRVFTSPTAVLLALVFWMLLPVEALKYIALSKLLMLQFFIVVLNWVE